MEENIDSVENTTGLNCDKCDFSCSRKADLKKHKKHKHSKSKAYPLKKCNFCDKTFAENWELETHLKGHEKADKFECEKCDTAFVLKWRLRKHESVHNTDKYCHYYNNRKDCPFEEIGCKFRHEPTSFCKFKNCDNSLCQFKHKQDLEDEEVIVREIVEKDIDSEADSSTNCKKTDLDVEKESENSEKIKVKDTKQQQKYYCGTCLFRSSSENELNDHVIRREHERKQ